MNRFSSLSSDAAAAWASGRRPFCAMASRLSNHSSATPSKSGGASRLARMPALTSAGRL